MRDLLYFTGDVHHFDRALLPCVQLNVDDDGFLRLSGPLGSLVVDPKDFTTFGIRLIRLYFGTLITNWLNTIWLHQQPRYHQTRYPIPRGTIQGDTKNYANEIISPTSRPPNVNYSEHFKSPNHSQINSKNCQLSKVQNTTCLSINTHYSLSKHWNCLQFRGRCDLARAEHVVHSTFRKRYSGLNPECCGANLDHQMSNKPLKAQIFQIL